MNLIDLLQMTKPQATQQQSEGLGPIMQFLAQHSQALQMPAIQMPQTPDYGAQIMAHGLREQEQRDQYAAHLKAKNDMEQQQAQAIVGHEAELSDDPQIQAMLKSGNPQLVAYAMKIAEDEKQSKIKAQYGENPTYQKWLHASPEEKAAMEQYLKLSHPGTQINMGDKSANDIVWMTPEQKQQVGLDPTQPYAINQKTGMPEAVKPNEFTDAQNQATGYYNRMVEAEKILDQEMAAGFETGSAKEAIANVLPYGLGGLLRTPQQQRVRQAQEDWVRAKLRKESGANIPSDEMDREIQTYFPGLNETDPSIIEQKRRARLQGASQLLESTGGKRVGSGAVNPLLSQAADRLGIPTDHPVIQLANVINAQESGGNANIHDSVDGAVGGMQVMPSTFREVMPNGNIKDPLDNATAGLSYLLKHWTDTGGDPMASAMRYHGGPAGDSRPNVKDGLGVSNKRYGEEVLARLRRNQPDEKAKNEARRAALEERAKRLGVL